VLALAACSKPSPSSPTTSAALDVTANPNPIASRVCTGCGAGSIDREAVAQLTIRETAGVAATVTARAGALPDNAGGAIIASGEFDEAGVTALAGASRLPAQGTLVARDVGVHYAAAQAGRAATLTFTVRIRDDRGNTLSRDLAVPVPST